MRWLVVVCVVLAAAVDAYGQRPSAAWRTIETEHFRIHYPSEYEEWTERAASRLESIRGAVVREVGYDPDTQIDVIVSNPVAAPGGFAWTMLDRPRIVLYTEPPGPDEMLGAYTTWAELVATHEVAHIVHMLRPSRNPLQRLVEQIVLPLNRITLGAPRWVLEGYATVVEGRLTGGGRPSSTARALVLRQWAANGQLPSYDALNSDSRFLGLRMAYLVGSAYLEWLEERGGEGSLRKVWARMTANRRRSFDAAFTGVFGESPRRLYGQFTASLTAAAVAANDAAPMREGELWQETSWRSGDPAVSPDGDRLVIVVRRRNDPPRLVIWSTGPADEEEKRYQEELENIRSRDPEDVPSVRSKPLRRDPIHTFTAPNGGDLLTPRWMPGGGAILYTHRQPDRAGVLHHDLFLWTVGSGDSRRITHLADVKEADPLPDGRSAVAVRTRFGASQLVMVNLETGAVRPITEPSFDVVYAHPRVHRDGGRIAYVAGRGGAWTLVVRGLATGAESVITPDPTDAFASLEWRRDGDGLIVSLLSRGFIDLHLIDGNGRRVPITRTSGGATQPAPAADGRIFFMSLEPHGFVVRVIDGVEPAAAPPVLPESLIPAIPPAPPVVQPFASASLPAAEPYGIGRQEISWLAGVNVAPSQNAMEAGIRVGDVVGRLDTIAVASFGAGSGQRGVAVASAWRGWPVHVAGHLFRAEDDRERRDGVELRGVWSYRMPLAALTTEGGMLTGTRDLAFIDGRFRGFRIVSGWRLEHDLSGGYAAGDVDQTRWLAAGTVSRKGTRLRLAFEARRGDEVEVGGLPSTIVPRSAFIDRVLEPALPVASLRGESYQGLHAEAEIPLSDLTLFYRRHRISDTDLEIAGVQLTFDTGPAPLIRFPALDVTLGVGHVLSGPLERDTNWWLGVRWRP